MGEIRRVSPDSPPPPQSPMISLLSFQRPTRLCEVLTYVRWRCPPGIDSDVDPHVFRARGIGNVSFNIPSYGLGSDPNRLYPAMKMQHRKLGNPQALSQQSNPG